jgi:hypothetical protein
VTPASTCDNSRGLHKSKAALAKQLADSLMAGHTGMLFAAQARTSRVSKKPHNVGSSREAQGKTLQKTQVRIAQGLYTTVCTVLLLEA